MPYTTGAMPNYRFNIGFDFKDPADLYRPTRMRLIFNSLVKLRMWLEPGAKREDMPTLEIEERN